MKEPTETSGPGSRGSCRAGDIAVGLGMAVYCALIAAWWIALVLAELSLFRLWPCLVAFIVTGAVVFRLCRRRALQTEIPAWQIGIATLVASASLFLTLPASEMVKGGWDPGVYLHTAAALSQTGTLQLDMPDLTELSTRERSLVSRNLHRITEPFGGMRVLPNGRISPQFFHLYPSAMAMLHSMGGVRAALLLNPLLNAGCVLLIFALATRILGRPWGCVAALFLCLNPIQIWQGKFCTAEIMTQFLLLGGFHFLLNALSSKTKTGIWTYLLAGCSFGLALLARYDTLLPIAFMAMVPLAFVSASKNRRGLLLTAAVVALFCVQAYLHMKFVAPYYKPMFHTVLIFLGALFALYMGLLWVARRNVRAGSQRLFEGKAHLLWYLAGALFLAWAVYAWFIRPHATRFASDIFWFQKIFSSLGLRALASHFTMKESINMLYLANMLGYAGLALGILGTVVLIVRSRDLGTWIWLFPSAAIMVFFVTNVFHDHFMLWVARRFVPIVVPLLAVSAAAAVKQATGWGRSKGGKAQAVAGVSIVVIALFLNIHPIMMASRTHDWPGLINWFEDVNRVLPERSLVYSDQPGFAAPLRFLFDRQAYELRSPTDDRRRELARVMRKKLKQGREVFLLTSSEWTASHGVRFLRAAEFPLESQILNRTKVSFPLSTKRRGGKFVVYRAELKPEDSL